MAHYSVHISTIQRSKGQNAIACSAYISRSKLSLTVTDKQTNISWQESWDYRAKPGLAHSKIYTPEHLGDDLPEWMTDREKLWNKVEKGENRCNSECGEKLMVALPNEFTLEQNIALVEDIVSDFTKVGRIVDVAIHTDNDNNPHMHGQLAQREIVKNRYGELDFSPIKNPNWRGPRHIKSVREMIAGKTNKHLKMNGFNIEVSEKSYKERGIDLVPTLHEGPARNIKQSELVAANIEIAKENIKRIEERPSIVLDKLVVNTPVFTKEDVAKELDGRIMATIDWRDVENVEAAQAEISERFTSLYERIMNGPDIEMVVESDLKDRTLYTTTKRLALEERFEENIRSLASSKSHSLGIDDSDLDKLSVSEKIAAGVSEVKGAVIDKINKHTPLELEKPKSAIELSPEQRKAILGIVNGGDISMLEGLPGAGKTTVMREVVRQYRKAGYTVIGVATSSAASLELQKATGIECKNASLWRKEWQQERGKKFELKLRADYYKEKQYQDIGKSSLLSNKHVVLLDEASMVELANMDYLVSEVKASGAKLVGICDNNQLPAVGYQGASLKISEIAGSEKLQNTRRQQNPEHREATKLFGQYRIREALDIYWRDGSIEVVENAAEANRVSVDHFVNSYTERSREVGKDDLVSSRSQAILVHENNTRRLLNDQVREKLSEVGVLKGQEYILRVGSLKGKQDNSLRESEGAEQVKYRRAIEQVIQRINGEIDESKQLGVEQQSDIAYNLCRYEYKELSKELAAAIYQQDHNKIGRGNRKIIDNALRSIDDIVSMSDLAKSEREANKGGHYIKLQRGEQIVFARNANRLGRNGVFNGEFGTVLGVRSYKEAASGGDGLGIVDILVHKADGRKEKVAVNLREMANNPFFNDGIALDYGYAITANTAQGADIAHTVNHFSAGYEINNVTFTRHEEGSKIIVSREVLENAYYESLDQSSQEARNRFEISADEQSQEEVLKGGLVRLVSKRVNNNFASSYRDMGTRKEDKVLKSYIDNCNDAVAAFRKVTSWQEQEFRKTGCKPNLWDNKELWQEYKRFEKARNAVACDITSSYGDYKQRLTQMKMNYATIEKHARSGDKALKHQRVIYNQKDSILYQQQDFKELVQAVASGNGLHIRKLYGEVSMNIAQNKESIENHLQSIKVMEETKSDLQNAISSEMEFREKMMPEYLDRIYSKNSGDGKIVSAGTDAMRKYDELVEEHGADKAMAKVVAKPTLLGNLKGAGVGRLLAFGDRRRDAIALCQNLERQLSGYNGASVKLKELEAKMVSEQYDIKIANIQKEIEALRSLLPADIDNEFLGEVGSKLDGARAGGVAKIDWRPLQQSELFDAVRVKQFVDKDSAVVSSELLRSPLDKAELIKVAVDKGASNTSPALQKQVMEKESGRAPVPRITFEQVKWALSGAHAEDIFREYAPMINGKREFQRKGGELKSGSMYMVVQGSKTGLWYRFSDGSKGDVFGLVREATGCSSREALDIVAEKIGVRPTFEGESGIRSNMVQMKRNATQETIKRDNEHSEQLRDTWVASAVVPETAPKFNADEHLSFLKKKGAEVTLVHEYRSKADQLLGYTVRIEKEDGKKEVMPVAWCRNEAKNQSRWQLKGFTDNGFKPIYGLEKLSYEPLKPVLIVEGEKTADRAQEMLPDYNVISWMGGAQGVHKVDWSNLKNMDVTIWPDNDDPGIEAATKIQEYIDNQNGFSGMVRIVDTKHLGLPKKWDLADKLPEHLQSKGVSGIIDSAKNEKTTICSQITQQIDSSKIIISRKYRNDLDDITKPQ